MRKLFIIILMTTPAYAGPLDIVSSPLPTGGCAPNWEMGPDNVCHRTPSSLPKCKKGKLVMTVDDAKLRCAKRLYDAR